jgi:hypothetical protein
MFSPFFILSDEDTLAENALIEGLKEKALYCLWNTVIDDTIEYSDRGKDSVVESFEALTKFRKGENFNGKTEVGQVTYDLICQFHSLFPGPNKKISEELIFLDLIRIINGLDYERIIHENNTMGTLSEYMEFGAITADVRVLLDIDIAIYPHDLDLFIIGELREAYRWFDLAFKLNSDIVTFEREYFVEASQNAVILHGQEKELLPRNILTAENTHKEQFFECVIPSLMNEIGEKGKEYLNKSIECLEKISEIDTSTISAAFRSAFETYPGERTFSPPPDK